MKTLKKTLYLLLLLALPIAGKPQAPVVDLPQIAATFLNFLQSLEQAIETTEKIAKGVAKADTTIKRLQAIRDVYDKINPILQNAQTIKDVTQRMYYTIEITKNAYNIMRKSKHFTHHETIDFLDKYDFLLQSMTRDVNLLSTFLTPDAWKMNDKQRKDATAEVEADLAAKEALARKLLTEIMITERNRQLAEQLWEKGQFLTPFSYLMCHTSTLCVDLPPSVAIQNVLFDISKSNSNAGEDDDSFSPNKIDAKLELGVNQITAKNRNYYENMFKLTKILFFAVCAFMALFGALRIYRKIQAGEDFVGNASAWIFGILLVYGIGELISIFFFAI